MTIREKILVIEDEQTISNFISAILTANGYDVLLARNGAVADSMIASHCPDIIILDLGLPDMDAWRSCTGCARGRRCPSSWSRRAAMSRTRSPHSTRVQTTI